MKVFALFLLVLSCSHHKAIVKPQGVERITIKQDRYLKPEFFKAGINIEKEFRGQNTRGPANFEELDLSNRQIYFLSVFNQYQKMGKMLGKTMINSCPSFHQVILENDSVKTVDTSEYHLEFKWSSLKNNQDQLVYFPILAMPVSDEKDLYTSLSEKKWQNSEAITKDGVDYYYQQAEAEIKALCDNGVSPGYYIFENMVTYFKQKGTFPSGNKAVAALVKIPALATMLILDTMKTDSSQTSLSVYDRWLLERSNTAWFSAYIAKMRSQRLQVLAKLKGKSKDTVLSLNRWYRDPILFDNKLLRNK